MMTAKMKSPVQRTNADGAENSAFLAERHGSNNTPTPLRIESTLLDDAVSMMRIGVDALEQLEALFVAIDDCTDLGGVRSPTARLMQVHQLAKMGRYLAGDLSNCIDGGREKFESEHVPTILAACMGGAV